MEQDLLFVNTVINNDYLYDLIAIVHHMGETVNSGHYTATTRNAVDGKWRNYDDNNVRLVDPVDAADFNTAYLLFYERRSRRPHVMQTTSGQLLVLSLKILYTFLMAKFPGYRQINFARPILIS